MEGCVPKIKVCGGVAASTVEEKVPAHMASKDSVRDAELKSARSLERGARAAVVAKVATAVKETTLMGSFLGVVRAFFGDGVTNLDFSVLFGEGTDAMVVFGEHRGGVMAKQTG